MGAKWEQITAAIRHATDQLAWGCFIIVEYRTPMRGLNDPYPYAQAAPGPGGWYVEVVSERFFPEIEPHTLDRLWLVSAGFHEPDDETDNWWQTRVPGPDVAHLLADGLRVARRCSAPGRVAWRTGRFPDGPRGGLPHEHLHAGAALAS